MQAVTWLPSEGSNHCLIETGATVRRLQAVTSSCMENTSYNLVPVYRVYRLQLGLHLENTSCNSAFVWKMQAITWLLSGRYKLYKVRRVQTLSWLPSEGSNMALV